MFFYKKLTSNSNYIYLDKNVHHLPMQKLDDEQLEGSGFVFKCIEDVISEEKKFNDIQSSSWVELPEHYKK